MLALLSRASMNKPNPQGEWLKGSAIGKKLGIDDFVLPLNTEGLRPDEITWNLQPIKYIAFSPSWADGLASLLKKLQSIAAPRALNDGPRVAVESIVANSVVQGEPEELLSNCFEVVQTPRYIRKYEVETDLSSDERRAIRIEWACRDVSPTLVLAFDEPPSTVTMHHRFQCVDQVVWRDTRLLNGIDTRDLVVSLIHKCLNRLLKDKGMKYSTIAEHRRQWYIPQGLLNNDRVSVTFPSGKKSWVNGVGERTYKGKEVYRYHLSPSFAVLHDQTDPFVLFLRNRVYLTDANGIPLEGQKIVSRRKHLCKTWFNYEWCARTLGIAQLLADGDTHIRLGLEGEQQLLINAMPISPNAPRRIQDELVDEPDEIYSTWHEDDDVETAEESPYVE